MICIFPGTIQTALFAVDRRLHFFSEDADHSFRRRRVVFVMILIVAAASLVWPGYLPFSGIRPFVLGLPLSMAWVAFWILAMFAAMIWLYRSEDPNRSDAD